MIAYGEVGPKPVEYLVLAWVSGIGTALLIGIFAVVIGFAYAGDFGSPTWQQAGIGILIALFVALGQLLLAMTACFAILHSRSQGAPANEPIGEGYSGTNGVRALPFETTDRSRFWVAVYRSGWRVFVAIYAVVLAVILNSGTGSALLALPLIAVAVAFGWWHAITVPKKRAKAAEATTAKKAESARIDKELDAKQRRLERQHARPAGTSLSEEWIDRALAKAFTATAIKAVRAGDLAALDKPLKRAHAAMNERVPLEQLRERALEWVKRQA